MISRSSAVWRVPCLVVAVLAGAALPLGQGCTDCPEFDPEPLYRIVDDRPGWIAGSGRVRVTKTAFVVSYTTLDGSQWEVEYRRTEEP